MSSSSKLEAFSSMLDFCFDLDVDLEIPTPVLTAGSVHEINEISPVSGTLSEQNYATAALFNSAAGSMATFLTFSSFHSPMATLALWWTKLHSRPHFARTKKAICVPRLILKNRHNRNFQAEAQHAQMAESEEIDVFCRRLESLLTAPFDADKLKFQRETQLQNYYTFNGQWIK